VGAAVRPRQGRSGKPQSDPTGAYALPSSQDGLSLKFLPKERQRGTTSNGFERGRVKMGRGGRLVAILALYDPFFGKDWVKVHATGVLDGMIV